MSVLNNLACQALIGLPPPPARFTLDEWSLNNREKIRIVNDQQLLADSVLEESERYVKNSALQNCFTGTCTILIFGPVGYL